MISISSIRRNDETSFPLETYLIGLQYYCNSLPRQNVCRYLANIICGEPVNIVSLGRLETRNKELFFVLPG
jgi:hypothetical protein